MDEQNPFNPPRAALETAEPAMQQELAGLGARFGASMIDGIIGLVVAVPLLMFSGLWAGMMSGTEPPLATMLLVTVLAFGAYVAIHGYFLKQNGQTIGKKALGIRIVDLEGNVANFGKIIGLRQGLPVLINALPFVGGLFSLIDVLFIFRSDRRCIHDLMAGTQVRVAPK